MPSLQPSCLTLYAVPCATALRTAPRGVPVRTPLLVPTHLTLYPTPNIDVYLSLKFWVQVRFPSGLFILDFWWELFYTHFHVFTSQPTCGRRTLAVAEAHVQVLVTFPFTGALEGAVRAGGVRVHQGQEQQQNEEGGCLLWRWRVPGESLSLLMLTQQRLWIQFLFISFYQFPVKNHLAVKNPPESGIGCFPSCLKSLKIIIKYQITKKKSLVSSSCKKEKGKKRKRKYIWGVKSLWVAVRHVSLRSGMTEPPVAPTIAPLLCAVHKQSISRTRLSLPAQLSSFIHGLRTCPVLFMTKKSGRCDRLGLGDSGYYSVISVVLLNNTPKH